MTWQETRDSDIKLLETHARGWRIRLLPPCLFFLSIYSVSLFFIIRKYIAIVSYEQRQNYKDDFNAEYDEYRALHARMETVARRFIKLDAQRKRLSPGSKEYQVDGHVLRWADFHFLPPLLAIQLALEQAV